MSRGGMEAKIKIHVKIGCFFVDKYKHNNYICEFNDQVNYK